MLDCADALLLLAQQLDGPLLQQLDPPRRAIVLMALLGLVLLGISLVAATMIGGRWARRLARSMPPSNSTPRKFGERRLFGKLAKLTKSATGETIVADRASDETITD